MQIKYDFKELNKFLKKVTNENHWDKEFRLVAKSIARVLHQHLLEQTPVDTGNLREMWNAGANLQFRVVKKEDGYTVTLYNRATNNKSPKYPNFKYGLAVNDGHKTPGGGGWVMGKFFVENSVDLTYPKVEQIVMKELEKWWDSV